MRWHLRCGPVLWSVLVSGWLGCSTSEPVVVPVGDGVRPYDMGPASLGEGCTPLPGEVACAAGLRCALLRVGEAPYQGWLTQCASPPAMALAEGSPCAFDAEEQPRRGGERRFADRCGAGLSCVETLAEGWRCRPLCALRKHNEVCGKGRLCVIPAQVSSLGFCEAPSGCAALAQRGCPAGVGCYVLGEDKAAGTFCVPRRMLGGSDGQIGSACERSSDCAAGLGCVTSDSGPTCRPYCAAPADGGSAPCPDDLGTCEPYAGLPEGPKAPGESVGRCL